jgi:hypothetical protein
MLYIVCIKNNEKKTYIYIYIIKKIIMIKKKEINYAKLTYQQLNK